MFNTSGLHLEEHSKPLTNCSDFENTAGPTSRQLDLTHPQAETALYGAAVFWRVEGELSREEKQRWDSSLITLPGQGPARNVFRLLEVGAASANLEADSCCVGQKEGQDKIN